MPLSQYNYSLPKELIAQQPLKKRAHCKLLVLPSRNQKIEHKKFYQLLDYLRKDDVLVLNETKVLPAKLTGQKSTGSPVELILEKKIKSNFYLCRLKTKHPQVGNQLLFPKIKGEVTKRAQDRFYVRFSKNITSSLLNKIGETPLPPYIQKKLKDSSQYQTVYSQKKGSLAAPTAGLHFTPSLLHQIAKRGVKIAKICLHISFGTFIPLETENFLAHRPEKEYFEITQKNADLINHCRGRLIAVGTTVLKALESAADSKGKIKAQKSLSNLFITPRYKLKTKTSLLITNFHLPKTSLLLLVSCFAGRKRILQAYQEAIKKKYRFYSFGDAMFLFRENSHPQ